MTGGGRHDIARQRDRYLQRQLRTCAAVEGRAPCAIVVDPERTTRRAEGNAPGVFQHRVLHRAEKRSEEHTSELQSLAYLVCRLLLEKKNRIKQRYYVL